MAAYQSSQNSESPSESSSQMSFISAESGHSNVPSHLCSDMPSIPYNGPLAHAPPHTHPTDIAGPSTSDMPPIFKQPSSLSHLKPLLGASRFHPATSDRLSTIEGFAELDDEIRALPSREALKLSEKGKLLESPDDDILSDPMLRRRVILEENEDDDDDSVCRPGTQLASMCTKAAEHAEELVVKVWEAGWRVVQHHSLPHWLRDNEFLLRGHRPPTYSFRACFKSIFRIHTETGNIWTHLLGFIAFVGVATYFLTRPTIEVQWQEKAVFSAFFCGAILCMGFSWTFHTVFCHSERVGRLFNKLDYCGIALLTMGSFVPWLYYSFYCRMGPKIAYLVLIFCLGICAIIVSLWDKFSEPEYRALRAGTFIALGLSGVIPAMHYVITDGFYHAINYAALGWLFLMAVLYIAGALIYAFRIPERLLPGKFDIWFQSHQIFHVFVVAAALVHYHGITEIATYRLTLGDCLETDVI